MTKPVCWWCCYPFDWDSLHFPHTFTANTFHTVGHFCSWGCMKAYSIERGKFDACDYITLMRKRIEGKITPIKRAPSRFCLELFGGNVSIEDFRSGIPIRVNVPGEVFNMVTSTKEEKIEIFKLKREKPLEREKGKLENSLGVVRKCHAVGKGKKQ